MDLIKGYTRQPRSSPPKPRTDFSAFSCSPPPFASSVSLLDSGSSDFEEETNENRMMKCSLGQFRTLSGVATLGSCKTRLSSDSLMARETSSAANLRSRDDDGNIPCHADRNQSNGWIHREEDTLLPEDFLEARSLTLKQDSQCASQDVSVKTSPMLTRSKTSFLRKEKGDEKQSPNNNFLEVHKLLKSAKMSRRSRIMRQLGLIAPTGSPF